MPKSILLKPRLSEKTFAASEQKNTYVFDVPVSANRHVVSSAITSQYGVVVKSVRIARTAPKPLRSYKKRGRSLATYSSGIRKAYVTLSEGHRLPMFDSPKSLDDDTSTKFDAKEKK